MISRDQPSGYDESIDIPVAKQIEMLRQAGGLGEALASRMIHDSEGNPALDFEDVWVRGVSASLPDICYYVAPTRERETILREGVPAKHAERWNSGGLKASRDTRVQATPSGAGWWDVWEVDTRSLPPDAWFSSRDYRGAWVIREDIPPANVRLHQSGSPHAEGESFGLRLSGGPNRRGSEQVCLMEAVSFVGTGRRGRRYETPPCTSPILSNMAGSIGRWLDPEDRAALVPLIGPLSNTPVRGSDIQRRLGLIVQAVWVAKDVVSWGYLGAVVELDLAERACLQWQQQDRRWESEIEDSIARISKELRENANPAGVPESAAQVIRQGVECILVATREYREAHYSSTQSLTGWATQKLVDAAVMAGADAPTLKRLLTRALERHTKFLQHKTRGPLTRNEFLDLCRALVAERTAHSKRTP